MYGIEVGEGQLDKKHENNPKIKNYENINFKDVQKNLFDKVLDYITCDVSFISCWGGGGSGRN